MKKQLRRLRPHCARMTSSRTAAYRLATTQRALSYPEVAVEEQGAVSCCPCGVCGGSSCPLLRAAGGRMCAGGEVLPPGWVTCVLCVLLSLCSVPAVHSSPGPTATIASPTGANAPQPPAAANGSSSHIAKGDLSSTMAAPPVPKPQTQRALAVLVVVSAAVIIYFVIRTIRTRRKNKKTRKYGVLDTNIGNMELTPLEQEEEDDDTLFDANQPRR